MNQLSGKNLSNLKEQQISSEILKISGSEFMIKPSKQRPDS